MQGVIGMTELGRSGCSHWPETEEAAAGCAVEEAVGSVRCMAGTSYK